MRRGHLLVLAADDVVEREEPVLPRVAAVGVEGDALAVGHDALLYLPSVAVQDADVVVGLSVQRGRLHGAHEQRERGLQLALEGVEHPEIVEGLREGGADLQACQVALLRLLQVVDLLVNHTQVVVGLGAEGVVVNGHLVVNNGLDILPRLPVVYAKVVPGVRVVRVPSQRALVYGHTRLGRALVLHLRPQVRKRDGEVVPSDLEVGGDDHAPLVARHRLGHLALGLEHHADVAVGLRVERSDRGSQVVEAEGHIEVPHLNEHNPDVVVSRRAADVRAYRLQIVREGLLVRPRDLNSRPQVSESQRYIRLDGLVRRPQQQRPAQPLDALQEVPLPLVKLANLHKGVRVNRPQGHRHRHALVRILQEPQLL
mmetsp:Transcript_44865/g.142873  ORF Transcript_44865/g.142873 Transcript_44865/m.142873 type:complete len:370 (-) Transcript_44865:401-1510(-)